MEKRTLVLVGILCTIGLAGIDGTVVGTVMPVALRELGGSELYTWTFAAYMLATAITMPIWGPGSDRWGRKRTFLTGVAVFVLGSIGAAVAPTMPLFIAARALQGVGAGAVTSLPFIVLGVTFPPEMRGKALGVVSSAWAISSVAGPLLGTAIVTNFSWRWVFLINLPIGIASAILISRGMQESVGDRAGKYDLAGALLAGGGGAALIAAFVATGSGTFGAVELALVAAGVAMLALFVWVESRAEAPVLPMRFFRHRGYAMAMGASVLSSFAGFALAAYLPLHAADVYHSAAVTGLVVAAFTIGWSVAAFTTGRLIHRFGERRFVLAGVLALALGVALLVPAFTRSYGFVAGAAVLAGVGMGLQTAPLTVTVQNSVAVRQMGSATTSQQFARQIGAALGVGSFGLLAAMFGFAGADWALLVFAAATLAFAFALPHASLAEHRARAQPSIEH